MGSFPVAAGVGPVIVDESNRSFSRRAWLKAAAALPSAIGAPALLAACEDDESVPTDVFPQGVASGDPRMDGVLLWTRVEPRSDTSTETVAFEVAEDPTFERIVAQGERVADPSADHTVRVRLEALKAYTTYYYRFRARGVDSPMGRTKTTPAPDQDVPVRFAFASCQDFVGRHFHAWQWLAEREQDVDFVLFLGDYIYEYSTGTDVEFSQTGGERSVKLPDGLDVQISGQSVTAARTLRDYRALYKRYRSDPNLRRAHALFPFMAVWDDHEFANDCWQDHATDFNDQQGDERSPERRMAATRAWFEHMPVDAPFDSAAPFPTDARIYRSFRWGRHLELVLTDQRYYRSDHVIPEGPPDPAVGKLLGNSALGSRTIAVKAVFDEREKIATPTMLGEAQRQWLVDGLKASTATWKVWGSAGLVAPMLLDLRAYTGLPDALRHVVYFKVDHWDGFRTERAQILGALEGVRNLTVLSGDIHAFYAAHLHVDFDAPKPLPIGVEFTVAAISSASVQEQVQKLVDSNRLLKAFGLSAIVPQFDANLRAAGPHFAYANSKTNGIALVEVDGDRELRVEFIQIDDVASATPPPEPRRARFAVASGSATISDR